MSQDLAHITEEWRPAVGYEGLYEVSNLGRVRSLWKNGRLIRPFTSKQGYVYVVLCLGNRAYKREAVHRLVAKAFILNDNPERNHIDHKDGNRENNIVSNIQWVTRTENMHNPITEARIDKAIGRSVLGTAPDGTTKEYHQIKDVEKDGFSRHKVSACCLGMRKTHKDWKWRYTR